MSGQVWQLSPLQLSSERTTPSDPTCTTAVGVVPLLNVTVLGTIPSLIIPIIMRVGLGGDVIDPERCLTTSTSNGAVDSESFDGEVSVEVLSFCASAEVTTVIVEIWLVVFVSVVAGGAITVGGRDFAIAI